VLPKVIIHSGVSVDGRTDRYAGDVGLYYELVGRFEEDATLCGSNTVLTAFPPDASSAEGDDGEGTNEGASGPLLVVVDSRGRIGNLHQIRRQPYWREVVVLCSDATPQAHLDTLTGHGIAWITVGQGRVDLRSALEALADRFGVEVVRVDSGGVLNGVLLREGLVDEVSVLVYPGLVGGTSPRSLFVAPDLGADDDVIQLELCHLERLRGDAVWMRYRVNR
jgi:2,5-diamino-6-(ribosylamino)-4(3H)-pyrimidinone 5'-phosphate reductase